MFDNLLDVDIDPPEKGFRQDGITVAVALSRCILTPSARFQDLVSHLLVIPQESVHTS
jgi:hypothetical protein